MKEFYGEYIELIEKDRKYLITLTVINTTDDLLREAHRYLDSEEMNLFHNMKMYKRKCEFLIGRVCAKISVMHLKNLDNPQCIHIDNGYFRQPFINNSAINNCQISISHSEMVGAAIAFPEEIPMGIDLEKIDFSNRRSLISQFTDHEKEEVVQSQNDTRMFTLLWTAKEAVSKLLRVGFTSSVSIYEIDKITFDKQSISCSFIHFPQIQTISICFDEFVLTLALPSNIKIHFNWDILKGEGLCQCF